MKRSLIVISGIFILFNSCRDVVREYDRVLNERKTDKPLLIQPAISYSGDSLNNIAYPVGGIGTGNVLMGGRGNILEWEIFGKADQDELPPYMTFFAIHVDKGDGNPVNRVLEGVIPEDQPNPFGVPRQQLTGIPRFSECHFQSDFPFARTKLSDRDLPLGAALTTW
ncbi:MAG: GH116 family glycosyl-hydrolase, partial [Bacteroidales bacterium]